MAIDPDINGWPAQQREYLSSHRGAVFTVELGELVESGFELDLSRYPIFDESYREHLNAKILNHYWFREIGFETPQLFKRYLNVRMAEIMPFYNQLYESVDMDVDMLANVSMTTESQTSDESTATRTAKRDETGNRVESATTTAESTTKSRNLVSQTPQMQLSGRDDYASNIADAQSDADNESKADSTSTNDFTANDSATETGTSSGNLLTKVKGLTGVLGADAVMRYRETILNIDMLVVNDLADLFMGLYNDVANYL